MIVLIGLGILTLFCIGIHYETKRNAEISFNKRQALIDKLNPIAKEYGIKVLSYSEIGIMLGTCILLNSQTLTEWQRAVNCQDEFYRVHFRVYDLDFNNIEAVHYFFADIAYKSETQWNKDRENCIKEKTKEMEYKEILRKYFNTDKF